MIRVIKYDRDIDVRENYSFCILHHLSEFFRMLEMSNRSNR